MTPQTAAATKARPTIVPKPPKRKPESISIERAKELMGRCVALSVTFSGVGNRRKVSTSEIEVNAEKSWIGVTKKLIDAEELEAIAALDGEVRRYVMLHSVPSFLKKGVYLVPLELVGEVTRRLDEYAAKRDELVEKLICVYDKLVEDAKARLRDLFDPSDYPSADQLRRAFKLRYNYIEFVTPVSLRQVDRAIYEQESAKWDETLKEGLDAVNQLLLVEMAGFVDDLVDKLTPDEKGKKKIFRDSKIANVRQFLETLKARNLGDNAQLNALGEKALALLEDVDPDTLRQSRRIREQVREGFTDIKRQLDPMIVDKPSRAITLED